MTLIIAGGILGALAGGIQMFINAALEKKAAAKKTQEEVKI